MCSASVFVDSCLKVPSTLEDGTSCCKPDVAGFVYEDSRIQNLLKNTNLNYFCLLVDAAAAGVGAPVELADVGSGTAEAQYFCYSSLDDCATELLSDCAVPLVVILAVKIEQRSSVGARKGDGRRPMSKKQLFSSYSVSEIQTLCCIDEYRICRERPSMTPAPY